MSDSQTFSAREPSAATLALNLMFSKLIDALIANGVLTNDQATGVIDSAIREIDVHSSRRSDQGALDIMKKFKERLAHN
jgi:polyhydroxyalkanoate synthesis regulator phasin